MANQNNMKVLLPLGVNYLLIPGEGETVSAGKRYTMCEGSVIIEPKPHPKLFFFAVFPDVCLRKLCEISMKKTMLDHCFLPGIPIFQKRHFSRYRRALNRIEK